MGLGVEFFQDRKKKSIFPRQPARSPGDLRRRLPRVRPGETERGDIERRSVKVSIERSVILSRRSWPFRPGVEIGATMDGKRTISRTNAAMDGGESGRGGVARTGARLCTVWIVTFREGGPKPALSPGGHGWPRPPGGWGQNRNKTAPGAMDGGGRPLCGVVTFSTRLDSRWPRARGLRA